MADPRAGRKKTITRLVQADFAGIATANVTTVAGAYVVVGTYTVPFGLIAQWGAHDFSGSANPQGMSAYISLRNTSDVALTGSIRLVVADPTRTNLIRVFEDRSEAWASSSTPNRETSLLLPEMFPLVQPQSLMEIWFKDDASSTIDYDATSIKISIPVTRYI